MTRQHFAEAFGLRWRSDIALPGFDGAREMPDDDRATIDVRRIERLPDRGEGRKINRGHVFADGTRIGWRQEAVFDMTGGTHVAYCPGDAWPGVMPMSFYSTVAALLLAWRGIVPLHASAVEIEGRAVLVAGKSGAGKSTLTAGLVGQGARFVADDLVAVSVWGGERTSVARGRPTIRLHPETAAALETIDAEPVADDPRGKWLARPRLRSTADDLPLGAILILASGEDETGGGPADLQRLLLLHIFRRGWMSALPVRDDIVRNVLAIASAVPVLTQAPAEDHGLDAQRRYAEAAMTTIRATLAAR